MIDVRIVCTHDAVNFADMLARLLSAEEHRVRVHYGRHSLLELDAVQSTREAVILVWSPDAPGQHYMLEWLQGMDPARLIEISRAPGAPVRPQRRSPVIDFANWRGDRGSRPWYALNERLRAVARVVEPPKPQQQRAALALGLVSVAAVASAVFVRADQQPTATALAPIEPIVADTRSSDAIGGPLLAIEPASAEEPFEVRPLGTRRLEVTQGDELPEVGELAETHLRSPTLLERLSELNPLRDRG